jgi:F0F1-type ATP synthase assembly protein I
MASGIIYLSIVGMWVAYFVPRWVHSHDEFSGKSVERYKSALKVVAGSVEVDASLSVSAHADYESAERNAKILLTRRIVFGILIVALLGALSAGFAGSLPLLYSLIPVSGFVIYVAHVRRQSVEARMHRRRVSQLHRSNAGVSSTNLAQVIAPKDSRDHWVPLAEREMSTIVLLPKGTAQARNEWQPNSVPVPTYVNAAKAVPSKRVIDLTVPGAWSDEQERLAREALSAAAPSRDEVFDQQLADEAVERVRQNRAANE